MSSFPLLPSVEFFTEAKEGNEADFWGCFHAWGVDSRFMNHKLPA